MLKKQFNNEKYMKKTIPCVADIMQTNIDNFIFIKNINTIKETLLGKFLEGTLFIVHDDYQLYGLLTDGDVRRNFAKKEPLCMKDIVTKEPKTIYPEDEASVALRVLRENDINILPVINHDKILIGYITLHMLLSNFSPERLYITETQQNIDANVSRHLARYNFALNFIEENSISLDCACGSGYGSKILSSKSKKVFAIDLSHDAISFAKQKNNVSNIEYIQNDISNLKFKESFFDNIISIETLEHIPFKNFKIFLSNINIWLKEGGLFIGSSPMLRYKDNKPFITNPYHINEMPREIFQKEIESSLRNFTIHFYYQHEKTFLPMQKENTGFCIVIARKKFNEL